MLDEIEANICQMMYTLEPHLNDLAITLILKYNYVHVYMSYYMVFIILLVMFRLEY